MKNLLKTENAFVLGITFAMMFMLFMLFNLNYLETPNTGEIGSIEKIVEPEAEQPYYEINLSE